MFDMNAYSQNRYRNGKFLIWLHYRIKVSPSDDMADVLTRIDPDDCFGWLGRHPNQEFVRALLTEFQEQDVRRRRPKCAGKDWSRARYQNDKLLVWLHHRIRMLQSDNIDTTALTEVLVQIDPENCRRWLEKDCPNRELADELLLKGPA